MKLPSGTQALDLQSLPCVVGVFEYSLALFPEQRAAFGPWLSGEFPNTNLKSNGNTFLPL